MSTRRFAQPWLLGIACAALAAAVVLPFTASPYAPPELLTALALVIGGLAGFLAGPLLGLVAVLAGLGSVPVVVARPGRVALALPVGAASAGGAVAVAADIGERARAQQNAKEADSKYQTLVMRLPLVTYLYAALDRSTPIYVSPQLEALLGYTPDEWLAQGDLRSRLLHPDD